MKVMMICLISLLFLAVTVEAAPDYAKWGAIAVKETKERYKADIIDYLKRNLNYGLEAKKAMDLACIFQSNSIHQLKKSRRFSFLKLIDKPKVVINHSYLLYILNPPMENKQLNSPYHQ